MMPAAGTLRSHARLRPGGRIPELLTRGAAGLVLACVVAGGAHRSGALNPSGAAAAIVLGTLATAAGWTWAYLLVAYFIVTSALSRAGAAAKAARTGDVVAKGGRRDWRQVLANGGVFGAACGVWLAVPEHHIAAIAAGSLAAAAADSWATEIGTLVPGVPRSILTLERVPPGTSGGVSLAGTAAMIAGAVFIGGIVRLLGFPDTVAAAAAAGGVGGALVDSVLGAAVQARRWCSACGMATEQAQHRCGTPTVAAGGVQWLDNDGVNFACALSGGLLAALLVA